VTVPAEYRGALLLESDGPAVPEFLSSFGIGFSHMSKKTKRKSNQMPVERRALDRAAG
jgi:hypothetical protein